MKKTTTIFILTCLIWLFEEWYFLYAKYSDVGSLEKTIEIEKFLGELKEYIKKESE